MARAAIVLGCLDQPPARRYRSTSAQNRAFAEHLSLFGSPRVIGSAEQASINSSRPAPKPKPTMTLPDPPRWMRAVAADTFYRARRTTRLAAFHVTDCRRQHDGRFRCRVSWRKHPSTFAGTVTVGDLDLTTGHFGFGLTIVRRDQATGTTTRIHVRYRSPSPHDIDLSGGPVSSASTQARLPDVSVQPPEGVLLRDLPRQKQKRRLGRGERMGAVVPGGPGR